MKRALLTAIGAAALALPVAALAASSTYEGHVKGDPEARVAMKISKGKKPKLRWFEVTDLAIRCKGGRNLRLNSAFIRGEAPISRRGRFAIEGTEGRKKFAVAGKVRRKRAKGTLRYSGPTKIGDRKLSCHSGLVAWRAKR